MLLTIHTLVETQRDKTLGYEKKNDKMYEIHTEEVNEQYFNDSESCRVF